MNRAVDYIKYMSNKLEQNEESKKYIAIGCVPKPSNAGSLFSDIPELKPLSIYL